MLELSLKEQKQINGGLYKVVVMYAGSNYVYEIKKGFNTLADAQHYAETLDSERFNISVSKY